MVIWRPVPGYEDHYQVSDTGVIRSLSRITIDSLGRARRQRGCRRRPFPNERGYLRVELRKDGRRRNHSVHRLVALAFLPAPLPGQTEVRHLDCNPRNNRATNLAWGTHSENMQDTVAAGRLRNQNMRKTACPQGHPYSGKNVKGERICHPCRAAAMRRFRERTAAA